MIDWDRVATLRAEIGATDFAEVLEMFLSESDEVIVRLKKGVQVPTLAAELHFLKGSALNLGFKQFAALCSIGEKLAEGGHQVDLLQVTQSYDASRHAFKSGLAQTLAA